MLGSQITWQWHSYSIPSLIHKSGKLSNKKRHYQLYDTTERALLSNSVFARLITIPVVQPISFHTKQQLQKQYRSPLSPSFSLSYSLSLSQSLLLSLSLSHFLSLSFSFTLFLSQLLILSK